MSNWKIEQNLELCVDVVRVMKMTDQFPFPAEKYVKLRDENTSLENKVYKLLMKLRKS